MSTIRGRDGEGRGERGVTGRTAGGAHPSAASLTRRSLGKALLGAGLAGGALAGPLGRVSAPARAAATPVPFGAAMQNEFFDDPVYRQAFLDHCDMIVPMNELKFGLLRPTPTEFLFDRADRIIDFAASHGRASRGNPIIWWDEVPAWLESVSDEAEVARLLAEHCEIVMGRYAGRLHSWDVVNEVIAFNPLIEGPLRDTWWMRALGPRHVPLAFEAAARADPATRLVFNDFDLEFAGARYDARRAVALSLVRQMKDRGLSVHAVGIQAHLYAELQIDVDALARFGEALKEMDCTLLVTELDVIDWQIEGGPAEQDAAAYRIVSDLLDGVLAVGPPDVVIAWGLTDRWSWISEVMPREDGQPERPLPLDADYRPKAWYEMLRARLAGTR